MDASDSMSVQSMPVVTSPPHPTRLRTQPIPANNAMLAYLAQVRVPSNPSTPLPHPHVSNHRDPKTRPPVLPARTSSHTARTTQPTRQPC
eukprot:4862028-Pyramimonas_sp.AAC.2